MTMPIHSLMRSSGPSVYYSAEFRRMIESHLLFLQTHPDNQLIALEPHMVYKYEHDLFGLLGELNVPPQYHWIIMRMNGFTNPIDLTQETETLLLPSLSLISNLQKVHSTTTQITT